MSAHSGRGSLRRALASQGLRRLLTAFTVSWFGDWLYGVALAVFVYEATGSPAWVAAASVARMLPYLLLSPYAGVLVDRFPKVRILVASELISAVLMAALTVLSILDGPALAAVVLATLTAAAGTATSPAILAILPEVVDETDLAAANALTTVSENVATVAGPAVSVAMLVAIGVEGAFALNTVTFIISAILISRLRLPESEITVAADEKLGMWTSIRQGLGAAIGSASVRICMGFGFMAYALYGADTVLFIVLATGKLELGTTGVGYLFAALGLGGLLVVPLIDRLSASSRMMRALTLTTLAYCLPAAALALIDGAALALAFIVVRGAAFVVIDVMIITAMQRLIPASVLGRAFSVYASLAVGGFVLGAGIVPPLVTFLGVDGALLLLGLAPPVVALLVYPRLRNLDEQGARRKNELAPVVDSFRRVQILSALPRLAVERLAAGASLEKVAAHTEVLREGDLADAFYVVDDGRLDVVSTGGTGSVPVLRTELGSGDCFGEIGLLHQRPRTATVTARTDCTLYRVPADDFMAAVTGSPTATPAIFELARTRLARSHPS